MEWKITITKAVNGYVLSYHESTTEDDQIDIRRIVVEDPDSGDETITTQKMLWEVMEFFNLFGSKHDPVQVKIIRRDNNEKEIQDKTD